VNEKFLALCRDFGPENVGMMTGDASVNPHAPVLCCTAEILANIALAARPRSAASAVIMDEFHYYSDPERGYAWQVPLLTLPQARFLLMSATLGDDRVFRADLTRVTGAPSVTVRSDRRPVPLAFEYSRRRSRNGWPHCCLMTARRSTSCISRSAPPRRPPRP
jgi:superfamily II RNA helicase